MPRVYFAKFNFNEEIYEIYSDENRRQQLLFKLYDGINNDVELRDSDGTFKFISLDKNPDNYVVNGRIVLYAPGVHTSYDDKDDDVIERIDDKMAQYVTFSFDVEREIIGFVPKRDFGRKQFIDKLTQLIEKCCDVGEVKIFLETDLKQLQERLKVFSFVKEVNLKVIPPNGDRDDFAALMGSNAEQIKNTNATKFQMNFMGTAKKGINIGAAYIQKWIGAITRGYGEMVVTGKNQSKEDVTINSNDDAPFVRPITHNAKNSIPEVAEKTRAGISELLALKAISEVMMKDEKPSESERREI